MLLLFSSTFPLLSLKKIIPMESAARNLAISLLLLAFMSQSSAYDFYVGGRDGWGLNPSANYNNWAERNRFQVNDKLVFKYNKGEDSVLVVRKEDYDSCNTSGPVRRMEDGDSVFQFDRSGHFFFISGARERCEKGEKMVVAVMGVRNIGKKTPPPFPLPPTPSPAPAPSPSVSAKGPNFGAAFVPAPAPLPGAPSAASSSCGLSVARVFVGLLAAVVGGGFYFI